MVATAKTLTGPSIETLEAMLDVTYTWGYQETRQKLLPLWGSDIWNKMNERERKAMNIESFSWMISQFLHGEQGALLATAQLVVSVKDIDSKLYAGSQVVDEAR